MSKLSPPLHKNQDSERRIYEHLQNHGQGHPNILKYFGRSPPECELLRSGLLLEYHSRGTLSACFGKLDAIGVPETARRCWPYQAVSAVEYVHSRGVVHGDIGLHNFLVHDDGRLILCDFAGSGTEGLLPTISAGVRYANPQHDWNPYSTAEDDIFALGTVLYELDSGERLFEGQSSRDIYRHLRDQEFPDLSMVALPLRGIIKKCWELPGYKASDVLAELSMYFAYGPTSKLMCTRPPPLSPPVL
ncbi:kinase-like domain-containing protein [Leptodontidium sp. 2 PMI_412]|nr:kinase-like domain-containing protein [Leptodontidium sp. 2 PMI_412]